MENEINQPSFSEELNGIAEHIEWYLSAWMPADEIGRNKLILLSPDLFPTWKTLRSQVYDVITLDEFFCRAMDAINRYNLITQMTSAERTKRFKQAIKNAKELSNSINQLQMLSSNTSDPNKQLCDYVLRMTLNTCTVEPSKGHFTSESSPTKARIFLRAPFVIDTIAKDLETVLENPDLRLSEKTGRSGLTAFYTNSLCSVTQDKFRRPCFKEIANIANAILEPPSDKPITEENVRTNFRNYIQRTKRRNS